MKTPVWMYPEVSIHDVCSMGQQRPYLVSSLSLSFPLLPMDSEDTSV